MNVEHPLQWTAGSNLVYILSAFAIAILVLSDIPGIGSRYQKLPGAPIVGASFSFEPGWITRYRFVQSGWSIISSGWKDAKSGVFTVIRPESNITVIPRRYIAELSNIPDTRLGAVEAIDMMREYTGMDILLGSHLSPYAIKNKLTPQLEHIVGIIQEEMQVAADEDPLNVTAEWTEHKLSHYVSKLMGRITSRLFIGLPLCRNETWLQLNLDLVRTIFETAVVMRNLPRFTHFFMAPILPSRRKLKQCMEGVHGFLIPLIEERRKQEALQGVAYTKPQDVMQWMMDHANEEESAPENLSTRFVYAILGSMSTVVEVIMHCAYELCVRPEYIEPLREEMEAVLEEENGWTKRTAAKLVKTDSFAKEIFRHYPPSAFAFKRITKEQIILSDGLVLPKDTYVCVASTSPEQDEMDGPGSAQFDGFRYSKKRASQAVSSSRYDFAAFDKNHVSWGNGRYACPGRFAASIETKMILAHILLKYDLRLPFGTEDRPRSLKLLEFQFLDPDATVMLRTRTK